MPMLLFACLCLVLKNVGESETKRKLHIVTKEKAGLLMKRAGRSLRLHTCILNSAALLPSPHPWREQNEIFLQDVFSVNMQMGKVDTKQVFHVFWANSSEIVSDKLGWPHWHQTIDKSEQQDNDLCCKTKRHYVTYNVWNVFSTQNSFLSSQ